MAAPQYVTVSPVSILIGGRSCQIYDHTRPLLHPRSLDHLRIHEVGAEPLDVGDRQVERLRSGGRTGE